MKRSFLFVLPLTALLAISCRSRGDSTPNRAVVPENGTEVGIAETFDKLMDSVKASLTSDSIGVTMNMNYDIDFEANVPVAEGEDDVSFSNIKYSGESKLKAELGVKGLSGVGLNNVKASAKYSGTVKTNFQGDASMFGGILPNTDAKFDEKAYFDKGVVYIEISDGLKAYITSVIDGLGEEELGQMLPAGNKYKVAIPALDTPELNSVQISGYLSQLLDQITFTGDKFEEIVEPYKEHFTKFTGYKYSDTKYAFYAETTINKILSAAAGSSIDIAQYFSAMDSGDVACLKAGLVFDTQKGLETLDFSFDYNLKILYRDFANMSGEDISDVPDEILDTVLIEGKGGYHIYDDFKFGSNVKVEELSDSAKAGFVEMEIPESSSDEATMMSDPYMDEE